MRNIGFPLPDFEKMKMWMWSEQQRSLTSSSPLRLPLLQFLIQSAQVISFSFSSYSISNHFSPNFIFNFVVNAMQTKKELKVAPIVKYAALSLFFDRFYPSFSRSQLQLQLFHLHTYFRNLIQFFFFSQITLTMNLQFS